MANVTGYPTASLILSVDERAYLNRQVPRHRGLVYRHAAALCATTFPVNLLRARFASMSMGRAPSLGRSPPAVTPRMRGVTAGK